MESLLKLSINLSLLLVSASTSAFFVTLAFSLPAHAGEVYVTNQQDNSVSIIDTDTKKVLETVKIDGWFPHNIVFTPDGLEAWIANLGSANVSILDTIKRNTKLTLPEDGLCEGPIHPRRPWSEPKGMREDCSRVHEVAIRPDGRMAYITNLDSDYIWVFDVKSKSEVARIKSGSSARMVFSKDGKTGYVVSSHSKDIPIVDTDTNKVTGEIPVGKGVFGLAISPDDALLYVTTGKDNHFIILDISSQKKVADIMVGNDPHTVVVSADGRWAYVINRGDDEVAVIDTTKKEIKKKIKAAGEPDLAAIAGRYLYVTNRKANSVSVIDTESLTVKTVIPAGNEPHGIAVRP
ncbi:MAG: YncE family protein [Nitrospirae bacterium]|nr:YncE family protein [Nitrospirota bacterium]